MSGQPGGSSSGQNGTTPKAIGNLAKRQDDTTRRGTSKLKFTPVLPARRKKDEQHKSETKIEKPTLSQDARGRGRGAPRGRGRGQGEARGGAAPTRTGPEMIATGPLALGPTMTGSSSARRVASRSNFAPVTPLSSGGSTAPPPLPLSSSASSSATLNANLIRSTVPRQLKRELAPSDPTSETGQQLVEVEAEMYSDPEDGVEIVDIDDVRRMDWMAPESLRKERVREKNKRQGVKREPSRDKGKVKAEPQDVTIIEPDEEQVDHANALDLSESEEEEEMEDIFNDFALQEEEDQDMDLNVRQEKLYFFQFPEPFPTFLPSQSAQPQDVSMSETPSTTKQANDKGKAPESPGKGKKAVTFAPDVKPPASGASTPSTVDGVKKEETPAVPVDGVIGRLEIHRSGAVKMRLENGILLDVTAATQPSFLQHAVHVDPEKKRLSVIGEVNRRFVVSPNIDALLESLEVAEREAAAMDVDTNKPGEGLIKMEGEDKKDQKPRKKK